MNESMDGYFVGHNSWTQSSDLITEHSHPIPAPAKGDAGDQIDCIFDLLKQSN